MIKKICFCLLILQGCATAFDDIFLVVKNQTFGHPNQEVSQKAFEESEYSFMTLKIGRNAKVKLILNSINNGLYEWVSADLNSIYTYNGLIVKSAGLSSNISLRNYRNFSPNSTIHLSSILEFDKPLLAGVIFNLDLLSSKNVSESNNIYGDLDVYTYRREVPSIGWSSKDTYWVNSQNFVVFARQEVHPHMPPLELEYFYKF